MRDALGACGYILQEHRQCARRKASPASGLLRVRGCLVGQMSLVGTVFYEPVARGLEGQLREKLLALRAAREKARSSR